MLLFDLLQVMLMYFIPILIMIVAYSIILYKIKDRKIPGQQTDNVVAQQKLTTRRVGLGDSVRFNSHIILWTGRTRKYLVKKQLERTFMRRAVFHLELFFFWWGDYPPPPNKKIVNSPPQLPTMKCL